MKGNQITNESKLKPKCKNKNCAKQPSVAVILQHRLGAHGCPWQHIRKYVTYGNKLYKRNLSRSPFLECGFEGYGLPRLSRRHVTDFDSVSLQFCRMIL